ncbi:V4R domain-containing protein [Sedimentibacter sp.]|uniref:V4R domain-containing protein n=1 Tax=Sedimentibacter sp. TaxID=1960295 RepID=UPI000EC70A6B|nr:V4R domain-containing protein [Sedimentibacter sp.]HCX63041.1 4-vinyl reductase [Clostridiales bacterium]
MIDVQKQTNNHNTFKWESLGDIKKGRGDLGEEMPVLVYRLMQYTMLDVLSKEYGNETANEHFRKAGHLAGTEFAKNVLDLKVGFNTFVARLQCKLKELKIGILRMEDFNEDTGDIVLTVSEDLDCSGIPITNENVCYYDEGFVAGILEVYTGKKYNVREIDCWANGDRVCRFRGIVE